MNTRWQGMVIGMAVAVSAQWLVAGEAPVKPLLDVTAEESVSQLIPSSAQISAALSSNSAAPGIEITIQAGTEGYPGVRLAPQTPWDLSTFGHVEARVVNTGAKPLLVAVRVDNAIGPNNKNPWNTEQSYLKPGATGTVTVIFGYAYDHKPGYALNPGAVTGILLFSGKTDSLRSFRILSLTAGGPAGEKPRVDPKYVRVKPKAGVILGSGAIPDAAYQLETWNGAQATVAPGPGGLSVLRVVLPAGKANAVACLKPSIGCWDLRDASQVRVKVKNEGTAPVSPRVQIASNGGPTDPVEAATPLAPGAEQEFIVPFASAVPWRGLSDTNARTHWEGLKDTGTKFTHDSASAVKVSARHDGEAVLTVSSIVADAPVAVLPDWLGKRPPVDGDWTMTFQEEFDGTAVDLKKWSNYGPNYWDKKSHWSKDNVIVGGGVARMRYEKKRGYQNDDPKQQITLAGTNESDYASGILETYGKWVQRYGYFEARMKLPQAPGLWPAFWLMPDRGEAAGPQWKRSDTANGGMEFDIMEHLTRWGIQRYNIAMHWDGYGKQHKATGSGVNYVAPDKDGFITSGLLWEPGRVVFYGNGREIARWENPRISSVDSYILFTLPMGGWDNDALDAAKLPADFVIDYVRVWQRKDLASIPTR